MPRDSGPSTKEELRTVLDEIVLSAYENGVPVADGAYPLEHDDPDLPDWDLLITRVETSDGLDR